MKTERGPYAQSLKVFLFRARRSTVTAFESTQTTLYDTLFIVDSKRSLKGFNMTKGK